eukprot:evm.model.NODE_36268_length_19470_cov_28.507704.1
MENLVPGLVPVSAASLFSVQAARGHAGICIDEKLEPRKEGDVEEAMLRRQLVVDVMVLLLVVGLWTRLPPLSPCGRVGRRSDQARGEKGAWPLAPREIEKALWRPVVPM